MGGIVDASAGAAWSALDVFNVFEAVWWALLGVLLLRFRRRIPIHQRALILPAAAVLIVFAGSDLVELQTGAWWRPWWLAVWKVSCVAILIGLGLRGVKLRRQAFVDQNADRNSGLA